jgi:hypothetical protein
VSSRLLRDRRRPKDTAQPIIVDVDIAHLPSRPTSCREIADHTMDKWRTAQTREPRSHALRHASRHCGAMPTARCQDFSDSCFACDRVLQPPVARQSPGRNTAVKATPSVINTPIVGNRDHRARSPEVADKGRYPWLDSSLDLEQGLDVVELTFKEAARVFREPNLAHVRPDAGLP